MIVSFHLRFETGKAATAPTREMIAKIWETFMIAELRSFGGCSDWSKVVAMVRKHERRC